MSTQIYVKCIDQTLTLVSTPLIASGGINEDVVNFAFCQKWDGFSKTAIFYRTPENVYYSLLDSDNVCVIPQEVLKEDGYVFFGVFGSNANGVTRTSEVIKYKVEKGAITENIKPSDPTPSIYETLLAKYQSMVEIAQETLERERAFEQNFFKISDIEPADTPCLWFDTSGRNANSELLELSSNTDDSDINMSVGEKDYAVTNASLNDNTKTYNVDTKGDNE